MSGSQHASSFPFKLQPELLQSRLLPAHPLLPTVIEQHAAVLLCCVDANEPYTILTRRSLQLSRHAGQISLPGGRVEAGDASLEATALREAREEIGLQSVSLHVLGRLPDTHVPSTGIAITPVVAWSRCEPELNHDPYEVDEIIELPLCVALDATQYGTDTLDRDGVKREFRFLQYREHYIWGATARILLSLADTVR
ncbi:MAG TPA: CoA pyrophosphatase [Candidatus Acidoferrum sp.]|nr:CoA pyrophosphatase [Candidatus Acidoferrum sp.]